MKKDAEIFLNHLESLFGQEDSIQKVESTHDGLPPVHCFIYHNTPEDGLMTAVTFGLSAASHPDWKLGKPELMICVESKDESWALAAAWFAESFRGDKPFTYGSIFSTDSAISEESAMSAFLVFAPPGIEKQEATVQLQETKIHIVGFYPIYAGEIELYRKIGLKEFWHLEDFDPISINRRDLSTAS